MSNFIIYKSTNTITNMCYVGKTIKSLKDRKNGHRQCCKKPDPDYFHKALNHYGWDNFKWEIIYQCNDIYILNIMETFKIMVENSHVSENGYNLTWGGEGSYGRVLSDETKHKIGKANKNKVWTEEEKERLSNSHMGIKHTEVTKQKISNKHKGKIVSNETKQKLSVIGKNRIFSNETREKLSKINKGRVLSQETKQKISVSNKGRIVSEETKEKLRQYCGEKSSFFGKKHSKETLLKQSQVRRIYPNEMIFEAYKMRLNGHLIGDISNKFNIPYSTVQKWFRKPPKTLEEELKKYGIKIKRREKHVKRICDNQGPI